MQSLEKTIQNILSMTSQTTNKRADYSCPQCRDTGWLETEQNTYKRCSCYEEKHIKSLWLNYGVNPSKVKPINEYKPYDDTTSKAKKISIDYVKGFNEIKESQSNYLALFGQAGAGKSHLAIGVGSALLNKGVKVVYMPYLEGLQNLVSNYFDNENYNKLLNRFNSADVLIIDDLFKDKMRNGKLLSNAYISEADMKHIYPILNHRYYNNKPTIISTEATPELLRDLDEALTGRLLEKCKSHMVIFRSKKNDYRMKDFIGGK